MKDKKIFLPQDEMEIFVCLNVVTERNLDVDRNQAIKRFI